LPARDRSEENAVNSKRILAALPAILLALSWSVNVSAQAYPSKPIRFIMPYPAGGSADIIGRMLAEKVTADMGQQVVVDNRPGAGSLIASELTAKSAPDGHTVILGGLASHVVAPALQGKKSPYDPITDFTPITLATKNPNVLCVNPAVPVKTIQEYIALAKSRDGQLIYASSGNGTSQHLSGTLLQQKTGIRLTHVPYRGGAPAIADLVGGHVPSMFITLPAPVAHIKAGRLRAIGITSDKRAAVLPDVPTIAESGVPGYAVTNWYGVWGPAKIPAQVAARLNQSFVKALGDPGLRSRLEASGAEPAPTSIREFDAFVKAENATWKPIISAAGLQVQ
jgi:tripartite-type tricarboxylate transporter receptor subunit TctC